MTKETFLNTITDSQMNMCKLLQEITNIKYEDFLELISKE